MNDGDIEELEKTLEDLEEDILKNVRREHHSSQQTIFKKNELIMQLKHHIGTPCLS